MVFSSVIFLFYFLPLFLLAFFASGRNKIVILVFSLIFYAWGEPFYVLLMMSYIVVNFFFGLAIASAREKGGSRLILAIGCAVNLAPLIFFKYTNFLAETTAQLLDYSSPFAEINVLLPLGISFYTFHCLSYLIDVHRGDTPVERNFLTLAVYISMFPQLVAGPIIRFKTIAGDLHHPVINRSRFYLGLRVFIVGLGLKVLIANTLAVPVDLIFSLPPDRLTMADAWLGMIFYTLQIYYDFNGYSTMAIGLGLLIGYRLPLNFNYPYISASITEFWRRWHISLSQWFRDYLYIPLGGNRHGSVRTYANLVIVFLLCGIWHGAAWTFVVWGLYHGLFLVIERAGFGAALKRTPVPLQVAYALLVVMFGWVLFRAEGFDHAAIYFAALFGGGAAHGYGIPVSALLQTDVILALIAGVALAGPALGRLTARLSERVAIGAWRPLGDIGLLLVLFVASLALASGTYNPFIYFRF